MALFNFKDKKSRQQINHAITHRNDTRVQNAQNMELYQRKISRLADSRREWELADSIQSV